jgi:hypothetical protein
MCPYCRDGVQVIYQQVADRIVEIRRPCMECLTPERNGSKLINGPAAGESAKGLRSLSANSQYPRQFKSRLLVGEGSSRLGALSSFTHHQTAFGVHSKEME